MISPVNFPFWITKSVTFASKRTSPPRDLISSLIPATTFLKRSVPICGLFSYKISSGAPCSTKVSKTNLFLPNLSFTKVFNFPSENVPAPPSPNCTLDSEFSSPLSQKCSTSFIRFVTSFPRSKTIGCNPALASISAANRPAGPIPITTGGYLNSR